MGKASTTSMTPERGADAKGRNGFGLQDTRPPAGAHILQTTPQWLGPAPSATGASCNLVQLPQTDGDQSRIRRAVAGIWGAVFRTRKPPSRKVQPCSQALAGHTSREGRKPGRIGPLPTLFRGRPGAPFPINSRTRGIAAPVPVAHLPRHTRGLEGVSIHSGTSGRWRHGLRRGRHGGRLTCEEERARATG